MFAYVFVLDQPTASVLVGLFVAVTQMWQSWRLSQVHDLVNSNYTEAKAGRLAAEQALKTAQELNAFLQQQLNVTLRPAVVTQPVMPVDPRDKGEVQP